MTIGQTIRALRKKRGLTQAQLGALCGMTAGAISSYENGVTVPRRRVSEKIAAALEVPAERLFAPPSPPERAPACGSDVLLYDGVLTLLKELYGIVEGRILLAGNGQSQKYYIVRQIPGDFVLYESDIAAIVRAAKASMPPLVEHLQAVRGESV